MDTESVAMGVGCVEKSVPIWESLHLLFPNPALAESGSRAHSIHFNVVIIVKLTSGWKWNCLDFNISLTPFLCPVRPPLPLLLAKVSYEMENSWCVTSSIKLISTDLLIFKCLLSIAVKFCIFCKLFFPNSRCLKSLYIWFFYIPLFGTKCGFYLE